MQFDRLRRCAATALFASFLALIAAPVQAQMRGQIFVSGLTHPLAFVQDPTNPAVQFIVQKEGVIRVVLNGSLLPAPFLDLSDAISTDGERGLLSLALPPNAPGSGGRFFVSFADTEGNLVVARFHRTGDPLVADRASRFDLQWSTGARTIAHPFDLHYGAHLVFAPDGTNPTTHRIRRRTPRACSARSFGSMSTSATRIPRASTCRQAIRSPEAEALRKSGRSACGIRGAPQSTIRPEAAPARCSSPMSGRTPSRN
jgi:hypothetical protein